MTNFQYHLNFQFIIFNLAWMQATTPEYKAYQEQVLSNCSKFAQVCFMTYSKIVGKTRSC